MFCGMTCERTTPVLVSCSPINFEVKSKDYQDAVAEFLRNPQSFIESSNLKQDDAFASEVLFHACTYVLRSTYFEAKTKSTVVFVFTALIKP